MKLFFNLLFLFALIFGAGSVSAREGVDYWYIKEFKSQIIVQKDSSLDITEYIIADCGSAQKHGIYRTLPVSKQLTDSEKKRTPIDLVSITDFEGNPHKYQTIKKTSDETITWKIGSPDIYVSGENFYKIRYKVKNAILHNSESFDEFYWNLSGNFWDIPIDKYSAEIVFPDPINSENTKISTYFGKFKSSQSGSESGVYTSFVNTNTLSVDVPFTINPYEGVTVSATFPKDIVSPYRFGFFEKYGSLFFLVIPVSVLIFCFLLWRKYGDDPNINPTIAPEFEVPENLSPIDMGLVITDGSLKNSFISASIINLAVSGAIVIKKLEKKGILGSADFEIRRGSVSAGVSDTEKKLLKSLLGDSESVKISSLKNIFYKKIPDIKNKSESFLIEKGFLKKSSQAWHFTLIAIAGFGLIFSIFAFNLSIAFGLNISATTIIIFIFSFLMRSRPKDGAILLRRIRGFRLYMLKAEKYKQKYNEKENIFEKFLPYAILFGITKKWIKKMRDIYGEDYFNSYHPAWFVGSSLGGLDVDSIASEISSMSTNMASTISSSPSSSGSGGGGFSGGGGGGGGGGGW